MTKALRASPRNTVTTKKAASAKLKQVVAPSGLYIPRTEYKRAIEGLQAQGLDHSDAVATLRLGTRQANGRPIPLELLM